MDDFFWEVYSIVNEGLQMNVDYLLLCSVTGVYFLREYTRR